MAGGDDGGGDGDGDGGAGKFSNFQCEPKQNFLNLTR